MNSTKVILVFALTFILMISAFPAARRAQAMWLFQENFANHLFDPESQESGSHHTETPTILESSHESHTEFHDSHEPPASQPQQQLQSASPTSATGLKEGSNSYRSYMTSLLSVAGIQPSSIASVLNTVGDTGFRYFNIQDQCRNRAACDLGYMLFKKLSFLHNWLIRASVRTLTDMSNIYTQSWMEGMMGKNCSHVYASCRQSPLEGIMNLALIQQFAL